MRCPIWVASVGALTAAVVFGPVFGDERKVASKMPGSGATVRQPAPVPDPILGIPPLDEMVRGERWAKGGANPSVSSPDTPPNNLNLLTLEDLQQIALQSNPTLAQAEMGVRAAEGRYVQSTLYPNPRIAYVGDEIGNAGSQGLQGIGFRQEIVTAGKRGLGMAVASHEIQEARQAWEAQRWRVLNDVRTGYYEVLLAEKMIELNESLVGIGQQGVEVTEKLLAALEASQADVLQARIEAEKAQLNLHKARNRHRAAWQRLAAVLGRPDMEPQPLAGQVDADLPELAWDECLERILARSPELARARAAVERARCELARQCAERRANLEIGAVAKHDTSTDFTVADLELSVPLPLFARNQGRILEAQAALVAAQHEVRRTELELQDRLAAVFEQYANARREVETYASTILPNAKASLELVSTGYREGEFAYLTLLTAQRTYFDVVLAYLANLGELRARSVELEGMLLAGGLRQPPVAAFASPEG